MADYEFRRLLRQYYETDSPSIAVQLFHYGQRAGFHLTDYMDAGVPWKIVADNLWQLNPNLPTPEDTDAYTNFWVRADDRLGPFIKRQKSPTGSWYAWFHGFMDTHDDWHPCWPYNPFKESRNYGHRYGSTDKIHNQVRIYINYILPYGEERQQNNGWGDVIRIAFWGMDDTGIERDFEGREGLREFERVIRDLPAFINRTDFLTRRGFVRA